MSLGTTPPKIDAAAKVTGHATYPGDIQAEGMLHAKLLFTGQPHARLVRLDTTRAEAVPGVVLVLTAADIPLNEHGLTIFDQPVMVGWNDSKLDSDISLWEGDRVAMIVAETAEAAERGRDLIEMEWEPLPILTIPREAMRDEVILHRAHGSNLLKQYRIRKGDMAQGWAEAEVIIESTYELPMQEHAYLQPEAGVGYVDEAGRITVAVAGQWTHEDQHLIAHALKLPVEQVRVVYPAIGGAFGGREDMSVQIVLALAAQRLHQMGIARPVQIVWSREESIIGHHKRHAAQVHTRWGATREGLLTAVQTELILDAGSYNCTSNKVLGNAHLTVCGPYKIPHAHVDSIAVYTNNCPGGAFRGFGGPQGAFVAESQMNKLADALGLDPIEIRRRNLLHDGDETVIQTPLPAGVSIGKVVEALSQSASQLVSQSAFRNPHSAFHTLPPNPAAIRRGRGFACGFKNIGFSFGFPERCEATIELYGTADIERVVLRHAGADVGQGAHTAFKQMAAEAVGVPFTMVETIYSDTAETGDSGSASASRLTWMAGNAILGAAERARQAWQNEERPARGHFRFTPPATEMLDEATGKGQPNFTYGYVAQAVELAVDIETGHIWVERVINASDVGKIVNRNLIEGQVEGCVVQAHGYAITEKLRLKDGHIVNPRLSSYLIPGIQDVPARVETVLLEEPDPLGPWGVRGVAEMPYLPYAPAVTAALHAATGVWFDEFPLTPDLVVAKLS